MIKFKFNNASASENETKIFDFANSAISSNFVNNKELCSFGEPTEINSANKINSATQGENTYTPEHSEGKSEVSQANLASEADLAESANCDQTKQSIAEQSTTAQARAIRNYLISSYDYDLSKIRCQKSGRLTKELGDQELVLAYQLADYDLIRLSEELERFALHNSPVEFNWLNTSTSRLEILKSSDPRGFFNFAIKSIVEDSGYYQSSKKLTNGDFTSEGRFEFVVDYWRFVAELESSDSYASLDFNSLNDKLLLVLCIADTRQLEKLVNREINFDYFSRAIARGVLAEVINKLVSRLINDYKIKNFIPFEKPLTSKDIYEISRRLKARQDSQSATTNFKARRFQELKRAKDSDNYTNNLIGEAMLCNKDKSDFIMMLETRRAVAMMSNYNFAKLNSLAELTKTDPSRVTTARVVKLKF